MYPIKCVKYLNLPTIPRSVIDSIKFDDDDLAKAKSTYGYVSSVKSTEELNTQEGYRMTLEWGPHWKLYTSCLCSV